MTQGFGLRLARPALAVAAAGSVYILLLRFPPGQYSVYPACPIHQFTGLLCPGCGATRALAALLHGDIRTAFHLNALLVASIPFALAYAALAPHQRPGAELPKAAAWTLAFAATAFTIARNIHP